MCAWWRTPSLLFSTLVFSPSFVFWIFLLICLFKPNQIGVKKSLYHFAFFCSGTLLQFTPWLMWPLRLTWQWGGSMTLKIVSVTAPLEVKYLGVSRLFENPKSNIAFNWSVMGVTGDHKGSLRLRVSIVFKESCSLVFSSDVLKF